MNQILGAGASSRVFMNLREEKGYTYGAYTRLDAKRLAGDFEATAEVRTAVTGDSLREFFYELERIRTDLVTDEELADAKNFLTGVFPIRAETQEGLTNLIVNQQLYELADDYPANLSDEHRSRYARGCSRGRK
jgi:predicted Zn-dependent peptidase